MVLLVVAVQTRMTLIQQVGLPYRNKSTAGLDGTFASGVVRIWREGTKLRDNRDTQKYYEIHAINSDEVYSPEYLRVKT